MGQGISGVWGQKVELQEQLDAYSHLSSIWDIQIKHYLQNQLLKTSSQLPANIWVSQICDTWAISRHIPQFTLERLSCLVSMP